MTDVNAFVAAVLIAVWTALAGGIGWLARWLLSREERAVAVQTQEALARSQDIENLGSWSSVYSSLMETVSRQQEVIDELATRAITAETSAADAKTVANLASSMATRAETEARRCETNRASDNARHALDRASMKRELAERDEEIARMKLGMSELRARVDGAHPEKGNTSLPAAVTVEGGGQ